MYRDPRARYFNPPAGRYSKGDGTLIDADPPRGYYDPPPGYYPRDRQMAIAYGNSLGPLPRPLSEREIWDRKDERLKIGLGLSGGALGVAVLAPIIDTLVWYTRPRDQFPVYQEWPVGLVVLIGLGPPAAIATTVCAIRYGLHVRRRPAAQRVGFGPGGLRWRF